MNFDDITKRFPNASASFIKANLPPGCSGSASFVEHSPSPVPLAADKAEEAATVRLHIRFTSVRKRLCDPDNISVKWTLDCLRFAGIIRGDEPDQITLEVRQRKATSEEQEATLIEVFKT